MAVGNNPQPVDLRGASPRRPQKSPPTEPIVVHQPAAVVAERAVQLDRNAAPWFVGVSDWFDASVCALARRLERELLHGGVGGAADLCATSGSVERVTHGTQTSKVAIDGQVRAAIDRITREDAVLHAHAVVRLERDVREHGGELRRLRSRT